MPSDTKTRTILLADLVGSSAQVTRLQTERGALFLHDATAPIEDAVRRHDGEIVKFTGDGYLSMFESANDALEAADEIRNFFLRQRYTPSGIALDGVRVVVNTADVFLENGDMVGDGVIVTARLEKDVPTNSVWVTAATREVCSDTMLSFEEIGEVQVRGRARPVRVYALQSGDTNYLEENIVLVITDLHHYKEVGEELMPADLNDWLLKWGNLHREAIQGMKGRVRQFIADMSLLTFTDADEAFHAMLNLNALVNIHNEKPGQSLPSYHFKCAMCFGSLILSPTGVVGPLVNRTFEALNATPRQRYALSSQTYEQLSPRYQARTEALNNGLYLIHPDALEA